MRTSQLAYTRRSAQMSPSMPPSVSGLYSVSFCRHARECKISLLMVADLAARCVMSSSLKRLAFARCVFYLPYRAPSPATMRHYYAPGSLSQKRSADAEMDDIVHRMLAVSCQVGHGQTTPLPAPPNFDVGFALRRFISRPYAI